MRPAVIEDMPALLVMGRKFHERASPEWPWSDDGFNGTLEALIETQFVRITPGGFMAGMLSPMPLNPDWVSAYELLWWAEDGGGPRLMKAFRQWAKDNNANEIRWSCRSNNERVKRFYSRFSQPCEAVYTEILPCAFQQ